MCQFNFILTKANSNSEKIRKIATDWELNFTSHELKIKGFENLDAFNTTTGHCDCGSVLGKVQWDEPKELDLEKERRKLERKRFSKRRIDLLLQQKEQKFLDRINSDEKTVTNEAKNWIGFLNDTRLRSKLYELGVLIHQFRGKVEEEAIKINQTKEISSASVNVSFLEQIEDDQINWIKLK